MFESRHIPLILFHLMLIFASNSASVVDKDAIARVCVEKRNKVNLVCLGVYVDSRWILSSRCCYPPIKRGKTVTLYMGSSTMDCKSGIENKALRIKITDDAVVIQLMAAFKLTPHVSTLVYRIDSVGTDGSCSIFGSEPANKTRGSELIMTQHKFVVVPCAEKKKCALIRAGSCTSCETNRSTVSMSPIICDHKLVGFSEKNPKKIDSVQFQFLRRKI